MGGKHSAAKLKEGNPDFSSLGLEAYVVEKAEGARVFDVQLILKFDPIDTVVGRWKIPIEIGARKARLKCTLERCEALSWKPDPERSTDPKEEKVIVKGTTGKKMGLHVGERPALGTSRAQYEEEGREVSVSGWPCYFSGTRKNPEWVFQVTAGETVLKCQSCIDMQVSTKPGSGSAQMTVEVSVPLGHRYLKCNVSGLTPLARVSFHFCLRKHIADQRLSYVIPLVA